MQNIVIFHLYIQKLEPQYKTGLILGCGRVHGGKGLQGIQCQEGGRQPHHGSHQEVVGRLCQETQEETGWQTITPSPK